MLVWVSLPHTGGRLVFPLDDTYIHMAVARSLARHGVWGVTPYEFTSSTSSLLWPVLLAADRVSRPGPSGVSAEWAPLVLALIGAAWAVWMAARLLRTAPPRLALVALLAVVFLTPLPTLVVSGMEHTLHVAAVLWLLERVVAGLGLEGRAESGVAPRRRTLVLLGLSAALATAARYESLFVLLPAVVLLWREDRRSAAWAALAGGALPLVVFGLVSVVNGWPPVPNSLLLKRAAFELTGLGAVADAVGGRALRTLVAAPHLLVLVVAVLLGRAFLPARPATRRLDVVFVCAALLHAQLASTGWLFRYEAYLVAFGIVLLARHGAEATLAGVGAERAALALALVVAGAPLLLRGVEALQQAPAAARNVYEQQYQMGLLARRLPPGATVMANDIGALCYLADVRMVDLYGLATRETARARRAGRLDRGLLRRLAREKRPALIAVYRSWFADAIPEEWVEVATWRVPEKVVVADRTVSFFAPDAASAPALIAHLAAFQPALPAGVVARVASPPAR